MSLMDRVKHLLKNLGHALGLSLHDRLDQTDRQLDVTIEQNNALARTLTALLQAAIHAAKSRPGYTVAAAPSALVVETTGDDGERRDPDTPLVEFLYSYLPSRTILDIGEEGDGSETLLATGYKIYTSPGQLDANDIAVLRIHTAVTPRDVVSATQDHPSPVVLARFGDRLPNVLETLVSEMKQQDYFWHITVFRSPGQDSAAFQANPIRPAPDSRGSVLFFRSFELFEHAHGWCQAMLPRTFIRTAPGS